MSYASSKLKHPAYRNRRHLAQADVDLELMALAEAVGVVDAPQPPKRALATGLLFGAIVPIGMLLGGC